MKTRMTKPERLAAGKRRAVKRAKAFGWKEPFETLPLEARKALAQTGNLRIPKRGDRKRFGKSTRKRRYGHFSGGGYVKHLDARALRDRATERDPVE